jgi:ergothioneine biosynthesis protein EgtB
MSTSVHTEPRKVQSTLLERFRAVRSATDALRASLTPEDQMVQSMPDCSPAKWHAAHTTWFFETFLLSAEPWYKPFDPRFRDVFNSYYKQVGEHPFRGDRGTFSHPTLDLVQAFRAHVDSSMERLLSGELTADQTALIELGLNHEQQHQELILTDIKHAFWSQPLRPAYAPATASSPSSTEPVRFVCFEGGPRDIGHQGPDFSFDNELPRHTVWLQPFAIASRLVTNAEYLEFMNDDAYRRPELWLSDGWDTVTRLGWKAPHYWEKSPSGEWTYFTLSGQRSIGLNEPVCHVSLYEADAFARWSGARLATEAEWEHAAASQPVAGNFAEDRRFHPLAASGDTPILQMFGDVWEWTGSAYLAYPGFHPAAGAVGEYNGKFMCNQFVLRGGSCATPRSHIRATYRNFFPPHARWQFTGVRLAKDER